MPFPRLLSCFAPRPQGPDELSRPAMTLAEFRSEVDQWLSGIREGRADAQAVASKLVDCFVSRGDRLDIRWSLNDLPSCVGELHWLKHLNSVRSDFAPIREGSTSWLARLGNLETLSVNNLDNRLNPQFLVTVCQLGKLQTLELNYCRLQSLPEEIANLRNLQRLHLVGNELKELPDSLAGMSWLKHIDLSGNSRLGTVPAVIRVLNLESLILINCGLSRVPSWIGEFQGLKTLALAANRDCVAVPDSIWQLTNLESLDLSSLRVFGNRGSLPESVGNLKKLTKLDLHLCDLATLPDSIGELRQLESIELSDNPITRLPESMVRLSALEKLHIHRTALATVPEFVGRLPALRVIRMQSGQGGYETLPVWLAKASLRDTTRSDVEDHLKTVAERVRDPRVDRSRIEQGISELTKWADHAFEGEAPDRLLSAIANFELGSCLASSEAPNTSGPRGSLFRLTLALEQMLAHGSRSFRQAYQPRSVAQKLLEVAGPAVTHFNLSGIRTPRDEIEALARPDEADPRRAALEQDYEQIRRGWGANVHNPGFVLQGARLLAEMSRRIRVEPPALRDVDADIREAANARPETREALLSALDHTLSLPTDVNEGELTTTTHDTLRVVWTWVRRQADASLRDHLTQSFFNKLLEIAQDKPCNTGCVQRLLQTPEGIDHSLMSDAPDEGVMKDEMLRLAGEVNNDIEEGTRFDYNGEDPDPAEITRVKQALIRAHIEARFIGFKRLDRERVQRVAAPVLDMVKDL